MLSAHPALWQAFPTGDLAEMPDRMLAELYNHARAEREGMARNIGYETAAALMPIMGLVPGGRIR